MAALLREQGKDKATLQKIELRALIQQKRINEAENMLKQMNEVDEDSEFLLLRALCELSTGRRASATEIVRRAIELDSRNEEAIELQRFLTKDVEIKK